MANPDPNRFNPRNKALSEANTLLILASLKSGPKTVNELLVLTNLSRQTIVKKLNQNTDAIRLVDKSFPKVYYVGEAPSTIATENTAKEPARKVDAAKAAIKNDTAKVVFFPNTSHHDHSKFHDHLMNSEDMAPLNVLYRSIDSKAKLLSAEHSIKTLYDLIQFRKTLKGEFE